MPANSQSWQRLLHERGRQEGQPSSLSPGPAAMAKRLWAQTRFPSRPLSALAVEKYLGAGAFGSRYCSRLYHDVRASASRVVRRRGQGSVSLSLSLALSHTHTHIHARTHTHASARALHTHTRVHTHTHTHTRVHCTHARAYTHTRAHCTHARTHAHTQALTHAHTHAHTHTRARALHTRTHAHTHAHTHTHARTQTHARTHARTRARAHTHTHTHTVQLTCHFPQTVMIQTPSFGDGSVSTTLSQVPCEPSSNSSDSETWLAGIPSAALRFARQCSGEGG